MNWERQLRSEMVFAIIYAGAAGVMIAIAVSSFLLGHLLEAAVEGLVALPCASLAGLRLNTWRLIRAMVRKRRDKPS